MPDMYLSLTTMTLREKSLWCHECTPPRVIPKANLGFGWLNASVGSLTVTNVPLWWGCWY